MKKLLSIFIAAVFFITSTKVSAQDALGEIIKSGTQDAGTLITAYLNPVGKGFGVGLNNGWTTTPKVFKPGRFEIRVIASAAFVPEEEKTFDLAELGFNSPTRTVRLDNPNNKIAPTMYGEAMDGPLVNVYARRPDTGQEEKIASFYMPKGTGYKAVPTPMLQATLGLFKETAIMVRYMPELTKDDYSGKLFGIGLEHSLSQWLPIIRNLPLDITASVGFTDFTASYAGINVTPDPNVQKTSQQSAAGYYANQLLDFNTKAYSGSLLAGKGTKIVAGFLGVNYSHAVTSSNLTGLYPVTAVRQTAPFQRYIEDIKDPVSVNIEHTQIGLTGGFRFKLGFLSLFGQGTFSKYSSATAGFGFGWN